MNDYISAKYGVTFVYNKFFCYVNIQYVAAKDSSDSAIANLKIHRPKYPVYGHCGARSMPTYGYVYFSPDGNLFITQKATGEVWNINAWYAI